jgi:hypothetical protein
VAVKARPASSRAMVSAHRDTGAAASRAATVMTERTIACGGGLFVGAREAMRLPIRSYSHSARYRGRARVDGLSICLTPLRLRRW